MTMPYTLTGIAILGENYKSIQKAKGKTPDSPFLSAQQYII